MVFAERAIKRMIGVIVSQPLLLKMGELGEVTC